MKTVHYKGTEYRVIQDRGASVVVAPMVGRTPRQVLRKIDLDAKPVKKKVSKKAPEKAKATKKKVTKKAASKK